MRQTEVCFTVHMRAGTGAAGTGLGGVTSHQVSGTAFHTGELAEVSTALLLLHGAQADRTSWDGARPGVKGAPSLARELAGAGYGVFAIDRLGFGASRYRGSGYALTLDAHAEMTHEMVTRLRGGTYRIGSEPCIDGGGVEVGRGVDRVVLSGMSSGGHTVEIYATRHHDIDGIIPIAHSNHGVSDEFLYDYLLPLWLDQWPRGDDYYDVFPDYEACVRWLFHLDGVRRHIVQRFCSAEVFFDPQVRTPVGEHLTAPLLEWEIKAKLPLVGPTPVLLVFSDRDAIRPYQHGEPDTVTPEVEKWTSRCNCPVSYYVQPDASHAGLLHDSAPETNVRSPGPAVVITGLLTLASDASRAVGACRSPRHAPTLPTGRSAA
ncbi:MAG: alpha/beta hydrolase [Actinobacteria bacterium]|nr:alpha/beta hydrolase [Actinomycetota bacterium]